MNKIKEYFSHYFIPHTKNNFRAKALHINALSLYLVLAFMFAMVAKGQVTNNINVLGFATDITVTKLFDLTNQERTHEHLQQLTYNPQLEEAAHAKAQDMFAKNYWAHYSPDGGTPWDFILQSGYQYEYAGENLAKNFIFSKGVVDAWMKSKSHRENILRKEYSEVGFAVVNGVLNGEETTLVVQMFGKPIDHTVTTNNAPVKSVQNKGSVLAQTNSRPLISLPKLSFSMSALFLTFLLIVLSIDYYFSVKMNLMRVHGKNLAHFFFIGFMLIGLLIVSRGNII